jgi:hypothetical protein
MIGNILGAMVVFGMIGIMAYVSGEVSRWVALVSVFLVCFPVVFLIIAILLENKKSI